MKIRFVLGTLALVATAHVASASTNLLNNASFEDPLRFDFADLSNWNGFFGGPSGTFLQAFNDTGATPLSGDKALVTTIRGVAGTTEGFDAFTGHVQVVTGITAGLEYELAVWARTNPLITNGAEYRVEWQNSSGTEISRTNVEIQSLLTAEYQRFAFSSFAPAGATRAAIVVAVQSFVNDGVIAETSVAWDDASFAVVPAPTSLGVLGLGALVAGRRRRSRG
ncbi:MAG: PEP-CTERM sorting domain-containing protein [Planctomycetota bacterium]|nr:PEP-CTERM sorting domain-containing protein [Planctomycetota bacterium]